LYLLAPGFSHYFVTHLLKHACYSISDYALVSVVCCVVESYQFLPQFMFIIFRLQLTPGPDLAGGRPGGPRVIVCALIGWYPTPPVLSQFSLISKSSI